MFTVAQVRDSLAQDGPARDLGVARAALANNRIGLTEALDSDTAARIRILVEAVLASAPGWASEDGIELLERAAEASEALAYSSPPAVQSQARLRAALLYELAALPMMASAVFADSDGPRFLADFFKRRQAFGSLGANIDLNAEINGANEQWLLRLGICQDALALAEYEHDPAASLALHTAPLSAAARELQIDMSLTDVQAFTAVVKRRSQRSTRLRTPDRLQSHLRAIGFPPELWEAQARALNSGLLDPGHDAWGLAAPTGTGKTFLARLLVLDALDRTPESKVLYIVPSKALVNQVHKDLTKALEGAGAPIVAVRPQISALDSEETDELEEAAVLVLTPEKADLLLRIGADCLKAVSLVVIDEAHHIEEGTRGVLLELYLARLRIALAKQARYVLLSAVAPNINELTEWMGSNPATVLVDRRSTRMKVGVYRIAREGRHNRGTIHYTDGTELRVLDRGVKSGHDAGLVQLAHRLHVAGSVLVVARGQKTAETIAEKLRAALNAEGHPELTPEQRASPTLQRLDSRLEREMYASVQMRDLVRHGVAYHHAGLPPRVREALEAAISENLVTFVIATTTLAEGVNFPFSTVIVQSLTMKNPTFEVGKPMSWRVFTPRKFWNIAGRAGRPGFDHEGQVILYEASLGLERVDALIDPYTEPDIRQIPPVTSALATGLATIREEVAAGTLELGALESRELPDGVSKSAQGVVNLLRVGLAHARASGIDAAPGDYFEQTLAARMLPASELAFARRLVAQQDRVLDDYFSDSTAASVELVAELGLSIDTLTRLQRYVSGLDDWQLEGVTHVLYGGVINFKQLPYLLSSVMKNMAELEGGKLSGWYSTIVEDWCRGKPFSDIKLARGQSRLEDLIGLMYSRIQYILPWGLYATDRFVTEEAARRGIDYDREVNKLAYLVDAGVPDWAALRLTTVGLERTDAARLSRVYLASREARETTDIIHWLSAQADEQLVRIVRGTDRRRVDYDFERIVSELRGAHRPPT
jgi:superfamily II DNA/RNA helicase